MIVALFDDYRCNTITMYNNRNCTIRSSIILCNKYINQVYAFFGEFWPQCTYLWSYSAINRRTKHAATLSETIGRKLSSQSPATIVGGEVLTRRINGHCGAH